jgi:hypothetical protein
MLISSNEYPFARNASILQDTLTEFGKAEEFDGV